MMADIAGFSRLMERDESATFARLQHLRDAVSRSRRSTRTVAAS